LIALNPPNPAGSLQTEDPASGVTIENAEVTNADAFVVESDRVEELVEDDFQAGVDTRFISYQPQYNEYRNAPETVFEHSLLYNSFQGDDLVVRDQRLINDRRLNILLFSGEVSRASGQTVTLDPETIDGPTGPINITADSGPIEITVPTKTPSVWEKEAAIGTEFREGATHARVIDTTANRVTIELEKGETYQLRTARVAFDGGTEENEFTPIQLADQDPPGMGTGDGALPGPRVSNAQGPDPDDEPLEAGDEFELTADVSSVGQTGEDNWRGGTTIQAAEWYVEGNDPGKGNANPMEAVDGEYLNDVVVGVADEVSTDDFQEGTNTFVIRGQDSRGIWGEDTDIVNVEIEGEADPPENELLIRVDDVTQVPTDNTEFIVSYDAEDFDSNADSIEVEFTPESGQTIVETDNNLRGSVTHSRGGTRGVTYDITVRAMEGNDIIESRTIQTNADGQNPGANDNLAQQGSATLETSTIEDRTRVNQDDPRFRFTYTVSETGSFSEVGLFASNVDFNGGGTSEQQYIDRRSRNNVDLNDPAGGSGEEFKLAILVFDADGAVVDIREEFTEADDNGP
jgi:hypothetical protein